MDRRLTDVLLLIGTAVVVLNMVLLVAQYGPASHRGGPFVAPPGAFPIALVTILAVAGSAFGLWRMWVTWRGSR